MSIERDPVHAQAADWLARLDDPQIGLEETLAWQRWIQSDARHAAAFARMEELDTALRGMTRPATDEPASWRPGRTRRWLALAASLVVAVCAALWFAGEGGTLIETAVGENRSLRLDDGSRVTLGGGTQIRVAFGDGARRIDLLRGEALFVVAQETARPFSVDAGQATIRALGTEFNVRRGSDRVVVAVIEGRVSVGSARPGKHRPVRLDAGEQTSVDAQGVLAPPQPADIESAIGWRSGRLTFRGEPLRYVAEDVNRYAARPVHIGDAATGDLKFTGTVLHDNVPGWIESLHSVFGIRAIEQPDGIVLIAE